MWRKEEMVAEVLHRGSSDDKHGEDLPNNESGTMREDKAKKF